MPAKRLARRCMLASLCTGLCMALCTTTVSARDDNATPAEATAMVKEGIAYIKANGRAKAYAELLHDTPILAPIYLRERLPYLASNDNAMHVLTSPSIYHI